MTTTALALSDRRTDVAAFEPASIDEALAVSKLLVSSRLLPRSITTPEAAFAVIVTGRELGLSAMQSLRAIHIVEGKPTLSADLMVALVKKSDACLFFRLVESSATVAIYEAHRRNEPSPTRLSFTFEEAKAAGVTGKDNWRKYPAAMLRARCAAALARAVFPDLVLGVYDPDELSPAVDVTPAPSPAPAPVAVEVAPAPARRQKRAEPAPAPAAEVVVEAEVVAAPIVEVAVEATPVVEAPVVAPVPVADPVVEPSPIDGVVATIAAAADLAGAKKALVSAPAGLSAADLGRAFGAVLARCTTAAECNDAAAIVVEWKRAGTIDAGLVDQLRRAYLDRKAVLAASATKGA